GEYRVRAAAGDLADVELRPGGARGHGGVGGVGRVREPTFEPARSCRRAESARLIFRDEAWLTSIGRQNFGEASDLGASASFAAVDRRRGAGRVDCRRPLAESTAGGSRDGDARRSVGDGERGRHDAREESLCDLESGGGAVAADRLEGGRGSDRG